MKYMCPKCNKIGSVGRCCTDSPIPIDEDAIECEKYKLNKMRDEFELKYKKAESLIKKGILFIIDGHFDLNELS